MQRQFILIFFVLLSVNNCYKAQNAIEGLFITAADFNSGKLSYQKIPGKKYKLKVHELINTSTIKVIISDSAITLKKDSVFGYRDKMNKIYRFSKNTKYQIINPNEKTILLYSSTALGDQKNIQPKINYFFSADANSAIYKLTRYNLKTVFSNNVSFTELLDVYFSSERILTEYDNFSKAYTLNKIEKLSLLIKINP